MPACEQSSSFPGVVRMSGWRRKRSRPLAKAAALPNPSQDPWGGGVISLHGGAQSSLWPDTVRDNRVDSEVHKGRMQTGRRTAHAGSRLKLLTIQEGTAWKANLPAVLGKTRRTVDREDRGNVGIIRSPLRASILPDYKQPQPGLIHRSSFIRSLRRRAAGMTPRSPLRSRVHHERQEAAVCVLFVQVSMACKAGGERSSPLIVRDRRCAPRNLH